MKNSNDTIGNRTRDLLGCSAAPQPTVPPRIDQNCGHVAGEELGFLLVCSTVTGGHEKMLVHVSRLLTTCDWASIKEEVESLNNLNMSCSLNLYNAWNNGS